MRTTTRRIARWTVVGGTVLAAGAVTLAGSLRAAGATSLRSAGVTTMQAVRSMGSEIAANTIPARRDVQNQQGNPAPRYPDMLRSAGVEGSVVVEVSTDANGIPDTSSMRVEIAAALSGWSMPTTNTPTMSARRGARLRIVSFR